jgi:hypothetical protein
MRATTCTHLDTVEDVTSSGDGCQECLQTGGRWVHLRMCMRCGHIGCCDNPPGRHARTWWKSWGGRRRRQATLSCSASRPGHSRQYPCSRWPGCSDSSPRRSPRVLAHDPTTTSIE